MRYILGTVTVACGIECAIAFYAMLAMLAAGNREAASYASLFLLCMLACLLLFGYATAQAMPARAAHKRRIAAMRKRLAFDRVRHGLTIAMLLALATGSFAVPASARTTAAHHSPTLTSHAAHSARTTHAATHASLTHVAASLPHYAMPRTKR